MAFRDLREFIDAAKEMGEVKEIHGAHWDLEIGALTEIFAYREPSPLLLFDQIPDYPPSYRVASNLVLHPRRAALMVGMSPKASKRDVVWRWREILNDLKPIPPKFVSDGPLCREMPPDLHPAISPLSVDNQALGFPLIA